MLTLEDIKNHLGISSNTTIYKLIAIKSFPKIKIGKKYLIPKNKYLKWIENNLGNDIII